MKPTHKCDPARMALLYIRQQFICTTFKFDAYSHIVEGKLSHILEDELFQENTITIVVSHDNEWNDYVDQIVKL